MACLNMFLTIISTVFSSVHDLEPTLSNAIHGIMQKPGSTKTREE